MGKHLAAGPSSGVVSYYLVIARNFVYTDYVNIRLEQKFVAFFSSKIYIFYKISMTLFDRTKFQFLESVSQITVR